MGNWIWPVAIFYFGILAIYLHWTYCQWKKWKVYRERDPEWELYLDNLRRQGYKLAITRETPFGKIEVWKAGRQYASEWKEHCDSLRHLTMASCGACKFSNQGKQSCHCIHPQQTDESLKDYVYHSFACRLFTKGKMSEKEKAELGYTNTAVRKTSFGTILIWEKA